MNKQAVENVKDHIIKKMDEAKKQNSKQLGMDVYDLKLICTMTSFVYGLDF